jgi:hypothetical protein
MGCPDDWWALAGAGDTAADQVMNSMKAVPDEIGLHDSL